KPRKYVNPLGKGRRYMWLIQMTIPSLIGTRAILNSEGQSTNRGGPEVSTPIVDDPPNWWGVFEIMTVARCVRGESSVDVANKRGLESAMIFEMNWNLASMLTDRGLKKWYSY